MKQPIRHEHLLITEKQAKLDRLGHLIDPTDFINTVDIKLNLFYQLEEELEVLLRRRPYWSGVSFDTTYLEEDISQLADDTCEEFFDNTSISIDPILLYEFVYRSIARLSDHGIVAKELLRHENLAAQKIICPSRSEFVSGITSAYRHLGIITEKNLNRYQTLTNLVNPTQTTGSNKPNHVGLYSEEHKLAIINGADKSQVPAIVKHEWFHMFAEVTGKYRIQPRSYKSVYSTPSPKRLVQAYYDRIRYDVEYGTVREELLALNAENSGMQEFVSDLSTAKLLLRDYGYNNFSTETQATSRKKAIERLQTSSYYSNAFKTIEEEFEKKILLAAAALDIMRDKGYSAEWVSLGLCMEYPMQTNYSRSHIKTSEWFTLANSLPIR
jgi:hypothetical protein